MQKLMRRLTTAMGRGLAQAGNRRRAAAGWGLVMLLGIGQPCKAEVFPDVSIESDYYPSLYFNEFSSGQTWAMQGTSYGGFSLWSYNPDKSWTEPFRIEPSAPSGSIRVAADGRVGFGTDSPGADLHVVAKQYSQAANLRLEVTGDYYSGTPRQVWDLNVSAGDNGIAPSFSLAEPDGGTTPMTVESGTSNDTLYLSSRGRGHVGIGTNSPDTINNANVNAYVRGPDRHLNLNSDTGIARSVVQGQVAAETYLVQRNGPANQKVVRTRVINGRYIISTVPDTAVGSIEPYAICVRLSTANVGIKTAYPVFPLQVGDVGKNNGNGAHVTKGGVWTNASSRTAKNHIEPITIEQARETVRALQPVGYRYKNEPEEHYCGFIAEDVPELVATNDRKSLAAMDIVSVLTRVVQDQDRQLEEARQRNAQQQTTLDEQSASLAQQQELLVSLSKRLTNLEQQSLDGKEQVHVTVAKLSR